MEPHEMRISRWFWAWQDHQEESWLESMSREGWHLESVGFLTYTFERGDPRDYVYRLDYRSDKDLQEYLEFVEGAGWQYIGKMSGWRYFRLPVEAGQTAELYTDPDSKIAKYRRIIATLAVTSPVFLVVFLNQLDRYPVWFATLLVTVFVSLIGLYAVALVKLLGRINQLKRL